MFFDLDLSPTLIAMIGLVLGAIIGSFLNVVIIDYCQYCAEWTHEAKLFLDMAPDQEKSKPINTRPHCPDCSTQ